MSDHEYEDEYGELISPRRRWIWPGVLAVWGILALAIGLTFSPIDAAARGGFFRGHGDDPEAMRAHLDFAADWILARIDASEAQSTRVKAILERSVTDLQSLHGDHDALRDAIVAQLTAPEVDRAALEKLRSDQLARFDAASQRVTDALADVADVLSVEQRQELVELAESFHGRRHGVGQGARHGGWH